MMEQKKVDRVEVRAAGRRLDQMDAALGRREKRPYIRPAVAGGVVQVRANAWRREQSIPLESSTHSSGIQ